jgi:hypothetical protein
VKITVNDKEIKVIPKWWRIANNSKQNKEISITIQMTVNTDLSKYEEEVLGWFVFYKLREVD